MWGTHHHFPYRRRTDPGGGHGAHPVGICRRQDHDGLLVSLRNSVRGAFHPHGGRCRDARGTLHAAGFAGQLHPIHETHRLPGREPDRHRALRRRLGLFSLSGSRRSPGGNQYTVAIVRNFQSDAGRGSPDSLYRRAVQDEARPFCLDHHRSSLMGAWFAR